MDCCNHDCEYCFRKYNLCLAPLEVYEECYECEPDDEAED